MKLIGTHSGSFHLDETIGVSVLQTLYPYAKVVRSREPLIWDACDALVDVGEEYDPARNRFDHHQRGFSERRPEGGPYAGAGLVWRTYGEAFVKLVCPELDPSLVPKVATEVDVRLIRHADAVDVGITVPGPHAFSLSGIVDGFNGSWKDDPAEDDYRFSQACLVAKQAVKNLTRSVAAKHSAGDLVRNAETLAGGRILLLDTPRIPFNHIVCTEMPNVLYVIFPEANRGQYKVKAVPKETGSFANRAPLPAQWAGLTGPDLARVSGVPDAVFCHNGRFICGAHTLNGAVALAEAAVAAATA